MTGKNNTYNVGITLSSLNCIRTFSALYPMLCKKIGKSEDKSIPVLLFQNLNDISKDIAESLIQNIPQEELTGLLCTIFEMCREQLTNAVKKSMRENEIGKSVDFERFHLFCDEKNVLHLVLKEVSLDINELQKNQEVQKQLGLARIALFLVSIFSPKNAEKRIINGLEKEKNKKQVTKMLTEILEKSGVFITIDDYTLNYQLDERPYLQTEWNLNQKLILTDAVTDCLKDHLR